GLKVGILICYDVEFPEAVRALALAGAELIAVPTALIEPFGIVSRTLAGLLRAFLRRRPRRSGSGAGGHRPGLAGCRYRPICHSKGPAGKPLFFRSSPRTLWQAR
ncbi:MAG: hypothetical protein MUC57_13835, partial [Desulfobacterales bacterium]|nr:hypothetical protein [Desulfobacterales bacterium]